MDQDSIAGLVMMLAVPLGLIAIGGMILLLQLAAKVFEKISDKIDRW